MQNNEEDHLNLLAIFHYIIGGIGAFFSLFPLIHLGIGIAFMSGVSHMSDPAGNSPPEWFGMLFAVLGGLAFILGQTLSWLIIYSGRQIKKRKKYKFSFITACILCIFIPFGTILGVFTIITLNKTAVKELYANSLS